jgi:hypothetical protein
MRRTLIATIFCASTIFSAFALVLNPRPRQTLNDPSGQSLSTRDPGTVSTFIYKRWIWAWLGAELLWKGLSVSGVPVVRLLEQQKVRCSFFFREVGIQLGSNKK